MLKLILIILVDVIFCGLAVSAARNLGHHGTSCIGNGARFTGNIIPRCPPLSGYDHRSCYKNPSSGGQLNPYNLYASCAAANSSSVPKRLAMDYRKRFGKEPEQDMAIPCMDESAVTTYLNRNDVRKALGIPSSLGRWEVCSETVNNQYQNQYVDMTSRVQNAVSAGLRVMIYSGDVDMACNFLMGKKFTRMLGYSVKTSAKMYQVNGQIGGYHTQYGTGVHFLTVRGAGHMVPTDKPAVAYHILDSFLDNKSF